MKSQVLEGTRYYTFDTVWQVYESQHESTLGNLIADAYRASAQMMTGEHVDIALTASGVIRATMPTGTVTISDVFNIAPTGKGANGALISVYVTGQDLKNLIEMDASCHALIPSAQLFMSGVEYDIHPNRLMFDRSDAVLLQNDDGTLSEIENEKLYHLVTGMEVGRLFESVKKKTVGILSVIPRNADGTPLTAKELDRCIIKDENGNPLTEWYAIAAYLQTMDGSMDSRYAQTDGRKQIHKQNPMEDFLHSAGIADIHSRSFMKSVLIGLPIAIPLIVILSLALVKMIGKRKKREHIRRYIRNQKDDEF